MLPADLARLWFGTDEPRPSAVTRVAGALTADLGRGQPARHPPAWHRGAARGRLPLALPWPYRLPAGIAQRQSATLTARVPAAFRRVAALDHTTWAAAPRGAESATVLLRDGRLLLEPYAIARLEG